MPVRYANNCPSCRFLGRRDTFDLYFCENEPKTVLGRYGNQEWQFKASNIDRVSDPDLLEALRLAQQQGYLG